MTTEKRGAEAGTGFQREHVPERCNGMRFDQALAAMFPDYSRSRLQQWVRSGAVTLNAQARRPRDPVRAGDLVELAPPDSAPSAASAPEPIALDIVFEDARLLAVNKPAGLVVHPGAGNPGGTLVNALLHHDPRLAALPRAGIVHRLDKETSGLLLVARDLPVHFKLVQMLAHRVIHRRYLCLVVGRPSAGGSIEAPIGRHPHKRTRMAVIPGGKAAVTHFRIRERFRQHTTVEVRLETGRTHQIRVHMAHIGYPVFGDPAYGGRLRVPPGSDPALIETLRRFRRQALHAEGLELEHPVSGEALRLQAPAPSDLSGLLAQLRADGAAAARPDLR